MTIIGCDNGITGALAALSPHSKIIALLPMPALRARKGNEIDIAAVSRWIASVDSPDKIVVVIEEPGGSKSAKAAASMSGSFHALRAVCVIKGLRWHRVTPQAWHRVMLPGCKAGDTKPRALAVARELWPGELWLASERCRVPHDGMIDAVLIAEFARRTGLAA